MFIITFVSSDEKRTKSLKILDYHLTRQPINNNIVSNYYIYLNEKNNHSYDSVISNKIKKKQLIRHPVSAILFFLFLSINICNEIIFMLLELVNIGIFLFFLYWMIFFKPNISIWYSVIWSLNCNELWISVIWYGNKMTFYWHKHTYRHFWLHTIYVLIIMWLGEHDIKLKISVLIQLFLLILIGCFNICRHLHLWL